MPYGLTPTGFNGKPLEVIKAEIEADLRANISPSIDLETASPNGQLVGIFAGRERALWELLEAVYNSQYPDGASGYSLRQVGSITGTKADPATPSTALCTVNVDPGVYAIGDLIAHTVDNPEDRFANAEEVDTSAEVGATSVADVSFEAEETGPTRANAGTLIVIAEAVAGWNSVTNPADAELGQGEESDATYRTRRETELARRGSTTVDAIRVDLLDVDDVTFVSILENVTDTTDGNGLPGHSVECIVLGGTDADVAAAIFRAKAAGIQAYGSTTVSHVDDAGVAHSIGFTRPTEVDIYLELTAYVYTALWEGATVIKQAIADWGDINLAVGSDVIKQRIAALVMARVGVEDVNVFGIDDVTPCVTSANYAIGVREIARLDTARITIIASAL